MVPKTFNILFFIKKPKSPAQGTYPIYMRITVDGNRKEFSAGRKCLPDKWNKNIGRSTGSKEEFKELNYYFVLYTLQNGPMSDFFTYFYTHYSTDFENMHMALRSNFITQASTVAPGHVGTWQTSNAGHSKETYFNMVRTYYGQSAYDLLIQRYLNNTRTYLDSFGINEWHPPVGGQVMYGSSRLGIYQINLNLVTQRFDADVSNGSFEDPENISTTSYEPSYNFYTLQRGNKRYELSNHLGNVLAVVSDRKLPECIGDSFLYNKADITNATDYSPFGAPLPGRVYNTPTNITSDTTAWIKGWEPSTVSTSYVGNRLKVDVSTLWAGIRRSIKTVPGHNYVFKTTVDLHTAGSVYIFARRMSPNNTSGNIKVIHTSVSGTYEVHFTALDTLTYLHVEEGGSYTSGTVTFYLENTIVQDKQMGGKGYRFGFNGKENDNETQTQDYGMRVYDVRIGKFLSVDPLTKEYPYYSSYQFSGNSAIQFIDLDGAEPAKMKTDGFEQGAKDGAFAGRNMSENPVVITQVKNQLSIGSIKPFVPNGPEVLKNVLNSPGSNIIEDGGKFFGRIVFNSVNDMVVLTNTIFKGPNDANDMTGEIKTGQDRIDAGLGAITNLVPMEGIAKQTLGELKILNYSQFAAKLKSNLSRNEKATKMLQSNIKVKVLNEATKDAKQTGKLLGVITEFKDSSQNNK